MFLGAILADKFFHFAVFGAISLLSIVFVLFFIRVPQDFLEFFVLSISAIFLIIFISCFLIIKIRGNSVKILKLLYRLKFLKGKFSNFRLFNSYCSKKKINFKKGFNKIVRDRRNFFIGVISSVFVWLLIYLTAYLCFSALSVSVSFAMVIVAVSISTLLGDISPMPGGVGVVEGSLIILYSSLGISGEVAVTATLLNRLIVYFYNICIGGLSFLYLKFKD